LFRLFVIPNSLDSIISFGGIYYLQGRLAKLVASSLVTGIVGQRPVDAAHCWMADFSWNVVDGPGNNFGMVRSGLNFAF
jgi:hypothetical protein